MYLHKTGPGAQECSADENSIENSRMTLSFIRYNTEVQGLIVVSCFNQHLTINHFRPLWKLEGVHDAVVKCPTFEGVSSTPG